MFYSGIFVMVLGIGLLKPNVSSWSARCTKATRRASRLPASPSSTWASTWARPSAADASALGEKVNWHLGFLVCGIATLLGTIYFL
jgi:dipeptide/tripeptide permease